MGCGFGLGFRVQVRVNRVWSIIMILFLGHTRDLWQSAACEPALASLFLAGGASRQQHDVVGQLHAVHRRCHSARRKENLATKTSEPLGFSS